MTAHNGFCGVKARMLVFFHGFGVCKNVVHRCFLLIFRSFLLRSAAGHNAGIFFRRGVFHAQGLAQQEKQLRVVVQFLVALHLLRGKVSKIVAGQPADEKCAVDNVIVAQHTVQRQVFCNAVVITDVMWCTT